MSDESDKIANTIERRIYTVRGAQVMLDSDLAKIYGVETKVFNQATKRNSARFPAEFRFQLTMEEYQNLRSQLVTSSEHGGRRHLPYVFTEQGIAMLSAVLRSETAIKVSIEIMRAFVNMRKLIANNTAILQRLNKVEEKQIEADGKFDQIFKAIERETLHPEQGIFYDGQVFDARAFVSDIIRNAKKSIILIDNYIDESVLLLFTKRSKSTTVVIYTKKIDSSLKKDIEIFNQQYIPIEIKVFEKSHDRFLIIDKTSVFHIGASLKDLGKKWFAFAKIGISADEIVAKIEAG